MSSSSVASSSSSSADAKSGADSPRYGIIFVSGPIAAGKTTVASHLSALLSQSTSPASHIASIEGDTFWQHVYPIVPPKGNPARRGFFLAIMRAMTSTAMGYAAQGDLFGGIVVDFTIPPGYVEAIKKIAASSKTSVSISYAVLLPKMSVCQNRVKERTEGKVEKYDDGLWTMYENVDKKYLVDGIEENGEQLDPKQIAQKIFQQLAQGKFRVT